MALVETGQAHFHHLAFDVVDIGKMRDVLDHLARHGRWVAWGPTRHGIAGNIATYVRIVEEPCFVELYCDMEILADDHVPRTYPDDRYSSNTWGSLPPRSYFRFDPVAVESERESWETRGRPCRRRRPREPEGLQRPRTPEGRSSLVPYPPWHYVGVFLVVDYWADPERAVAFLPEGIEPHPDPGRCAFIAADWQLCSAAGDELIDPSRSQYKEVFVVVNGLLDGEEVTVCSYIWVDRDFALTRGWIQGFPKKLGSIWITRSFGLGGPADPGMEPGGRFGVTCAAYERRVAEATVTLERPSAGGPFHNAPPIVNVRHFPRLAAGRHDEPAVHELVRALSRDRAISEVWEGFEDPPLHTVHRGLLSRSSRPTRCAPSSRKSGSSAPGPSIPSSARAGSTSSPTSARRCRCARSGCSSASPSPIRKRCATAPTSICGRRPASRWTSRPTR